MQITVLLIMVSTFVVFRSVQSRSGVDEFLDDAGVISFVGEA